MMEFKNIPGYIGCYQLSPDGRVLSLARLCNRVSVTGEYYHSSQCIMSTRMNRNSEVVTLKKDGVKKCFTIAKLLEITYGEDHPELKALRLAQHKARIDEKYVFKATVRRERKESIIDAYNKFKGDKNV